MIYIIKFGETAIGSWGVVEIKTMKLHYIEPVFGDIGRYILLCFNLKKGN